MQPSIVAIVPAAGSGSRLREITKDQSKLLLKLETSEGERSVLAITLDRLLKSRLFNVLIVACSCDTLEIYKREIEATLGSNLPIEFIVGGASRQETVLKSLEHVADREFTHVAIHDAARPFVSIDAIEEVVAAGVKAGSAVLVERVNSTLKKISSKNEIIETIARDELVLAQTPQVFDFGLILSAHREGKNLKESLTDDSQLVERVGIKPIAVINMSSNPKITEPGDLDLARFLASR